MRFLGSTFVSTASGNGSFAFQYTGPLAGPYVTATAFNSATRDTSEFSPEVLATAPASTTVTLDGPSGLVTTGQPVTLTATVTPAFGPTPTGLVSFIDEANGSTLGTAPLGANGQATLVVSDLTPGIHAIIADYPGGGGSPDLPSISSALNVGVLATVAYGGPMVTGARVESTRTLVVAFNRPLLASTADQIRNYRIIDAQGKRLTILSATYDPATDSVTLKTRQRLGLSLSYKIEVNGVRVGRVDDSAHLPLEGKPGRPGSTFQGTVTPAKLVADPAKLESKAAPKPKVAAKAHPAGPKSKPKPKPKPNPKPKAHPIIAREVPKSTVHHPAHPRGTGAGGKR